jgi:hypothetical protein
VQALRFRTTIIQTGRTACGMKVPPGIVEGLGRGRRPLVTVTINGHLYRSTIAVYGDEYWLGVSAENRAGAGVVAGDTVDVDVEPDLAKREVVSAVPGPPPRESGRPALAGRPSLGTEPGEASCLPR